MNVGKALYNILSNDAEIVAICGTRVYPEIADQDAALPFIVYKVSDIQPSGTKSGSSSLDTARVDVYCVSEEYGEAMTISDEVRSALDRVGGTYTGVNIQSIDFDTADVEFDSDQRAYIAEATYNVRVLRVGQAPDINIQPLSILTVEEVDGDPSGNVNKLVVSNGALSLDGSTATITTGGGAFTDLSDTPGTLGTAGQVVAVNTGGTALEFVDQSGAAVQYHGRYDTEAETERSGATATLEVYYTARPDGDGFAESEVSDTGVTDTINRTLFYSTKYLADPDTAGDWTEYTTQPADNATFATAKAALLAGLNETDATAETRGTLPLSLKMVRTTSAAATDLLLDTYTGADAAYSVRKLDKDYTGYCMKVREDSGDTEADIGFDSAGDLDTAAIATHCGSANGYVVTWYDQSGNAVNATQSTASNQPQIYNGTSVNTENGKPIIVNTGSAILNYGLGNNAQQIFGVIKATSAVTVQCVLGSSNDAFLLLMTTQSSSSELRFSRVTTRDNGSSYTGTSRNDARLAFADQTLLYCDYTTTATNGNLHFGFDVSFPMTNVQEMIIYPDTATHTVADVESDINTYFSIFTP
jgi:hypothetical protein